MYGAFKTELDLPRTPVTFTYLILAQPRTGSTMITSALQASGLAGVPIEYFNLQHIRQLPKPLNLAAVQKYYAEVVSRRTSANGVFGMKIHHDQFRHIFMPDGDLSPAGEKFLRSFDRLILTSRRDKLAQALSQLTAFRKGQWNSTDREHEGRQNYEFSSADALLIIDYLRDAVAGEALWNDICARLALSPLRVVYEELCQSPRTELARVVAHLGLPIDNPAPQTIKLSRDSHRDGKLKFLREIGFDAGPSA